MSVVSDLIFNQCDLAQRTQNFIHSIVFATLNSKIVYRGQILLLVYREGHYVCKQDQDQRSRPSFCQHLSLYDGGAADQFFVEVTSRNNSAKVWLRIAMGYSSTATSVIIRLSYLPDESRFEVNSRHRWGSSLRVIDGEEVEHSKCICYAQPH